MIIDSTFWLAMIWTYGLLGLALFIVGILCLYVSHVNRKINKDMDEIENNLQEIERITNEL